MGEGGREDPSNPRGARRYPGTPFSTWNPLERPLPRTNGRYLAANLAIKFEESLALSDLEDPRADPAVVGSIRRSHRYGKDSRAGRAR